jgi:hypothetical protein
MIIYNFDWENIGMLCKVNKCYMVMKFMLNQSLLILHCIFKQHMITKFKKYCSMEW